MLCHTCILGGPLRQAQGGKSEVVPNKGLNKHKWLPHPFLLGGPKEGVCATLPLHSRGSPTPSAGRKIKGVNKQKWFVLGGPKEGANATSPLHSWGSPTPSVGRKIITAPKQGGKQPQVAASPRASQGPKRGRECYVTPAFSGVPNAKRGQEIRSVPQQRGKQTEVAA